MPLYRTSILFSRPWSNFSYKIIQCEYFLDKAVYWSHSDVFTFRCKNFGLFRNLWCVCTEEGWASADIFLTKERGFLEILASALFGAKTSDVLKFMVCPHGKGGMEGWASAEICGQARKGQFFAILCEHLLKLTLSLNTVKCVFADLAVYL